MEGFVALGPAPVERPNARRFIVSPRLDSRLRGNDNEAHSGTTAIAWISILARSSISAATCTAVIAG